MFPFTLHQLRILKTLAIEQNFTKAAINLHISQPSLSNQILLLERNLGVKLIKRRTSKIILTKKGKILLKYSERILSLCEESCRAITNDKNITQKEVKVGTNTQFGNFLLSKFLNLGIKADPQFNLNIVVNSTEQIATQILTSKLDIIIANEEICDFINKDYTVGIEYYMTETFHLILSNNHPSARETKISKTDLYNLNYITFESNHMETDSLNKLLLLNQIDIHQFKNIVQLDSLESIKTSVELGLGVAFLPNLAIEKELELEIIRIIEINNIKITQKFFIINTLKCLDSSVCNIFYNNLLEFRKILPNKE